MIKKDYDVSNIYKLDGRVPVSKAIPFGLQHVLAMFVSNVTPIILIAGVALYNGNSFSSRYYAQNKPVKGGYFAGYYNGKQNIVGRRLFVEV